MTPHVSDAATPNGAGRRVISEKTSAIVRGMLQSVVDEGTGHLAQIPGYTVSGKTGTAQKVDPETGSYGDEYVTSFIGFAPAGDPEYVALILVDEPQKDLFGEVVAAPAFQDVMGFTLSHFNVPRTARARSTTLRPRPNPRPGREEGGQDTLKPVSLETVARVVGGSLAGGDAAALATGASVDSRSVRGGELFFALKGRVDGTDFAPEAHLRGAVAAVATRPLSVPTVVVENPVDALQELARWTLGGMDAPAVVGITGTVGKTTVKDAMEAILRYAGRRVSATAGNFNNEVGLPLTVLAADERTEVLVLEMGATHKGDIAHLCRIAPPEVGVLTAVSPVHLDSFGSLEDLAAAKGELALALPESGSLVSPLGVPEAAVGSGRNLARRITFGRGPEADLHATEVSELESGLSFELHVRDGAEERVVEVKTPVFGTHLVEPLLAAIGALWLWA